MAWVSLVSQDGAKQGLRPPEGTGPASWITICELLIGGPYKNYKNKCPTLGPLLSVFLLIRTGTSYLTSETLGGSIISYIRQIVYPLDLQN